MVAFGEKTRASFAVAQIETNGARPWHINDESVCGARFGRKEKNNSFARPRIDWVDCVDVGEHVASMLSINAQYVQHVWHGMWTVDVTMICVSC